MFYVFICSGERNCLWGHSCFPKKKHLNTSNCTGFSVIMCLYIFPLLPVPHSAPVQVCGAAGQLRDVSQGREKVPVWLVQRRGTVHPEAPLPSHQPLHHPLAGPVQQGREVHQPTHHRGQSATLCLSVQAAHAHTQRQLLCSNQLP